MNETVINDIVQAHEDLESLETALQGKLQELVDKLDNDENGEAYEIIEESIDALVNLKVSINRKKDDILDRVSDLERVDQD